MSTRSTLVGEMSDSDAVLWTIGRDPVLRSPILAVMLLDEEPDWEMGLARVEKLTVIEPRLRARAVAQPYGLGNPQWVDDGRFDLAHHVHQVGAPPPGTFRGVLDLAQLMGTNAFDPELRGCPDRRGIWVTAPSS
jgi:diacylglycerol O-acyltransferase